MAAAVQEPVARAAATKGWCSVPGEDVARQLGVDPAAGLSAERAADLLSRHGRNALPAEDPTPGWRRFVAHGREHAGVEGARAERRRRSWSRRSAEHGLHPHAGDGSGLMIVTGTGSDSGGRKDRGDAVDHSPREDTAHKAADTLTLWIAGAAGITMLFMFAGGAAGGSRRPASSRARWRWQSLHPEAMPTVLQVILSLGAGDLAKRGAIIKDLTSVETLGSTSAINSDKTGTLTMNQMTATEVVDPTDRYSISGTGYELMAVFTRAVDTFRHGCRALLREGRCANRD